MDVAPMACPTRSLEEKQSPRTVSPILANGFARLCGRISTNQRAPFSLQTHRFYTSKCTAEQRFFADVDGEPSVRSCSRGGFAARPANRA
jgi:hypothetical protein